MRVLRFLLYLITPVFFFTVDAHAQFTLNGSATQLGNSCYQLTPNSTYSMGSAWSSALVSLNNPFDLQFDVYLGCFDSGADGMVFGLQPVSTSAGSTGGGMGFSGITPSLGIEFDTYQNTNNGDPSYDHMALIKNGDVNHNTTNTLFAPVQINPTNVNVEDCNYHTIRVIWDPTTLNLKAYFDCTLRIDYTFSTSPVSSIFSGNPNVYWGFAAATGGASNEHRFCLINNPFNSTTQYDTICQGDSVQLTYSGGVSYQWSTGYGLSDSTISNPYFSPDTSMIYGVTITDNCGNSWVDSAIIEVEPSFSLELGNDTAICNGDTIFLDASVPNQSISYEWNTGSYDSVIVPTSTLTYIVTATSSSGACSFEDQKYVAIIDSPLVDLGNDTVLCDGDILSMNVYTDSTTYLWQNGSTLSTFQIDTTGLYYVEVSNFCGTDTDSILIDSIPDLQLNLPDSIKYCEGDTFIADVTNYGNNPSYLWSTGSAAPMETMTTSGIYTVSINTTCQSQNHSLYADFSNPPPFYLGNDTTICAGDSMTIFSTNSTSYSHLWSDGTTGSSITVNTTNVYSLTVSDSTGCETSDSIGVAVQPLPVFSLGNDTVICPYDNTTFSAPANYTYLWSNSSTNQSITVNQQGVYSVTISDQFTCSAADSVQLFLSQLPSAAIQGSTTGCEGDTLSLEVNQGNATVLWSNGSTDSLTSYFTNQIVTVTLTNTDGCSNNNTASLVFHPLPLPNLGNDTSLCGNELTLYPGSYINYLWNTGSTDSEIEVNSSGSYSVTVTSVLQCSNSDTINVSLLPNPVVNLGNDTAICEGEDFSLTVDNNTSNSTIVWNGDFYADEYPVTQSERVTVYIQLPGGCSARDSINVSIIPQPQTIEMPMDTTICSDLSYPIAIASNSAFSYDWSDNYPSASRNLSQPGTYCLDVYNQCGRVSQCVSIELDNCECVWFIPNTFTPNQDQLNEYFMPVIDCENFFLDFSVFNRWGEEVFRTQTYGEGWDGTFNGSVSQNDIYVWKLHLRTYLNNGNGKIMEETGTVHLMR